MMTSTGAEVEIEDKRLFLRSIVQCWSSTAGSYGGTSKRVPCAFSLKGLGSNSKRTAFFRGKIYLEI